MRRPRLVVGSLAAAAGGVALATLASRVVGLGRWLVFSGSVGASCVGEVYAAANLVPNVLYEVAAGGVLAAVVVPLVAGALGRGERAEADRTASALLTWSLLVLVPVALLLALAAPAVAAALLGGAPARGAGCDPSGQERLAVWMLVVFAPQVPLYGVGVVLAGVLQAHRRFLAAALAPLASSLVVVAAYLGYARLAAGAGTAQDVPVAALAVLAGGTTAGVVALSLPLLVPARRAGVRLRPTWRFPAGVARRARHLAGAGLLALTAQQAAVLATAHVAHRSRDTGVLNVYSYVQALYLLPFAVLAMPLITTAFPQLAGRAGSDGPSGERPDRRRGGRPGGAAASGAPDVPGPGNPARGRALTGALTGVLAAGLAGAAVLVATAPAVAAFFTALDAGGDGAAVPAMVTGLSAYALGLPGLATTALLQRALYVRGGPWAGAAAAGAGWAVAAVVPLVLVPDGAGAGPTLAVLGGASAAGMTLAGCLCLLLVARAWGRPAVAAGLRIAPAMAASAALGGLAGRALAAAAHPRGLLFSALVALLAAGCALLPPVALRWVAPRTWSRLVPGRHDAAPEDDAERPDGEA